MATNNRKFSLILGMAQRIRSYANKVIRVVVPPPAIAVESIMDTSIASQGVMDTVIANSSQMDTRTAKQGILTNSPVAVQSLMDLRSG